MLSKYVHVKGCYLRNSLISHSMVISNSLTYALYPLTGYPLTEFLNTLTKKFFVLRYSLCSGVASKTQYASVANCFEAANILIPQDIVKLKLYTVPKFWRWLNHLIILKNFYIAQLIPEDSQACVSLSHRPTLITNINCVLELEMFSVKKSNCSGTWTHNICIRAPGLSR